MQSEPGQQCLRFFASDRKRVPAVIGRAKFPKQADCKNRHALMTRAG